MSLAPIDETYTPSNEKPALRAVSATGRIEGPLFDLTLRQTYVNAGREPLEVVYTFPLPVDAVFLGFASELGGERKTGVVVAKAQGERDYEQALQEGDAPVMIEQAADGLLTANIGNLKPGEQLVVELRWAQWLRIEQGRIRVAVPTAIAPRYGDAQRDGHLQPQQSPLHALDADYPLEFTLDVCGNLGRGEVTCATHAVTTQATKVGLRLTLAHGAALDRDVVFTLKPAEASLALQGDDGAAFKEMSRSGLLA